MFETFSMKQLKRAFAITKKDLRIYYNKGPVLIFGLITPAFLFLAFFIGRNLTVEELFPGLIGMAVFFSSTSIGPGIVPWETRSRTLERLLSTPISVWAIFLGDVLASFLYGLIISLVPLIIGVIFGAVVHCWLTLCLSIALASFCFSSLGILMSAYPPSDIPATVMMVSSLVKFPLLFISGVFIPLGQMPSWSRILASISPLTYFVDLTRYSTQQANYFPITVDFAALIIFTLVFLTAAIKIHEKTLPRRLL